MMDYVIMCLIAGFMALSMLYKAKVNNDDDHFFDIKNTNAMRGFWCIAVMMVHVPLEYQNRIQDMIGSFAYIGVTFFFMTSGYGLTISADRKGVEGFWKKRLSKLLSTIWGVNIFVSLFMYIFWGREFSLKNIFWAFGGWIEWLVGCYILFWLSYILFNRFNVWKQVCCLVIVLISIAIYYLSHIEVITATVWMTECYGFVWGILLATYRSEFLKLFSNRWLHKLFIMFCFSIMLGIAYIHLKYVPFVGEYTLKVILGAVITMFILVINIRVSFGNKINQLLGDISFEIYLLHGTIYGIMAAYHKYIYSETYILISIITTIIGAFIVHMIINRFSNIIKAKFC